MAKYQIWDKVSDIYTLVGEVFTADQWKARYGWVNLPDAKMIIGGGLINGTMALEFNATVDMYAKMGADFSACETDEDYLAVMEEFDNTPPETSTEATPEERTAAALEAMAAGQTTENAAALDALLTGEEA